MVKTGRKFKTIWELGHLLKSGKGLYLRLNMLF